LNILIETFHSPHMNGRVGGAETSLRLIAEEFAKKGHKVIFFSKSNTKTWFGCKKMHVNNVRVIVLTKFKLGFLNFYKFKKISKILKNYYVLHYLKHTHVVHTYNNIGIVKYYAKLKSRYHFKLVVRMAGLKLFEDFETKPNLIHTYEKYFKAIDLYNFISEGLKELVLKKTLEYNLKVNFEPYFVHDIGVDLGKLTDKSIQLKKQNTPFRIVMASRLSIYQKRQDILIETMSLLKNENIVLNIIGDGLKKSFLHEMAKELKVEDKIIFEPFKRNIWNYLKDFDLLVHACDYEGLSKIIIESMAVGLPVMSSDVLPMKNYISNNENGFLCENNPQIWASKILYTYRNQELLEKVSSASKAFAKQKYDSSKNIDTYLLQFNALN